MKEIIELLRRYETECLGENCEMDGETALHDAACKARRELASELLQEIGGILKKLSELIPHYRSIT